MKLTVQQVPAFLARPSAEIVLVYGSDRGRVSELADELLQPLREQGLDVTSLDGSDLGSNAAPIIDAATSVGLFSPGSTVRVRNASDKLTKGLKAFIDEGAPCNRIVFEADDLAPRSSLRKLCEASSSAAAVACYEPGAKEIVALARTIMRAAGKTMDPAAEAWLAERLPRDSLFARREVEKLVLYLGDQPRCTVEDASALIGDSVEEELVDAAMAAADGDVGATIVAMRRLLASANSPVAILRVAQSHFLKLHQARAQHEAGKSAAAVVGEMKPPVFFKLRPRFERQIAGWPLAKIEASLGKLTRAESLCKQTVFPEDNIVAHTLFEIAVGGSQSRKSP